MKVFYLLLLVLWLGAVPGFAQQTTLTGQVLDAASRQPVPFATVSVPGQEWGTAADEQGRFRLVLPAALVAKSRLLVTCMGYESARPVAAAFLAGPQVVPLSEAHISLGEVMVRPSGEKLSIVGRTRGSRQLTSALYTTHNLVGAARARELGAVLPLPQACQVKDVHFQVAFNTFRTIRLYVQLYRMQGGRPGAPLLPQSIPVDVAQKRGWVKVDVADYHLKFAAREAVLVAVQWRKDDTVTVSRNAFVVDAWPAARHRALVRDSPQAAWQEVRGAVPCIYLTASATPLSVPSQAHSPSAADTLSEPVISQFPPPPNPLLRRYHFGDSTAVGHFVPVSGAMLYYEEYGHGEPLLLLHGNGQSIAAFNRQIGVLSQHFRVIAVDTRGHGRSTDTSLGNWTYDLLAADMRQLLDALHLRRVKVLGWSDGGNTALKLALLYPAYVDRLAIMGANLFPTREAIAGWLLTMLENARDFGTFDSDNASRYARKQINLVLQEPQMQFQELKSIDAPVLVMAGEADVVLPAHTQGIAAHLPHAELTIFEHASHFAPQQVPQEFNQRVISFLQSR